MLLPGSTAVYDRATGQLVSCTPYSCPAGVPAAGSGVGGSGGDGDGGSTWGQLWAWLAGPTEAGTGGADGAVVNLAPLVCSSPVGAITISAPYASRTAGAVLLALLASEEGQQALWDDASAGGRAPRPVRHPTYPCSLDLWKLSPSMSRLGWRMGLLSGNHDPACVRPRGGNRWSCGILTWTLLSRANKWRHPAFPMAHRTDKR